MVPGVRRPGNTGQSKSAQFARRRREELGLTQAEVAVLAGVRDVKTIRNLETGRNWPNDLTRRGIEIALRIEVGTLDRLADDGDGGGEPDRPEPGEHNAFPSAQELIDLSSAISKLSQVQEAMLTRGDSTTATQVRNLIDAVSAVMAGYRPALEQAALNVERDFRPARRRPSIHEGRTRSDDQVEGAN